MRFSPTKIPGVWVVGLERHEDERGYFARTWCQHEFADRGLNAGLAQCSISFNRKRGTVRGMHYQVAPHEEAKLVRCTRGAIFDVAIDLRPKSSTFKKWTAAELTGENGMALYVPEGCAHGFQTLADASEVLYHISEFYHPESGRGVRWNDPAFGIRWPLGQDIFISGRDAAYADFAG